MAGFCHLHVHSEYSLLDGAGRVGDLARRARELGMDSLALTDHGVMYGVIPFYKACKAEGIKPILGMEAYVVNGDLKARPSREEHRIYHLILLAETDEGYRNLMKICSIGHLQGFYYKPRVNKEVLREHARGIIALSACLGGEVQSLLLQDRMSEAVMAALEYQDIFGPGNFYLELQDHGLFEQKKVNQLLAQLSQRTGIPLVATNDVHYVERKDAKTQDVLLCIGTGKKIDDPERLRFETDQFYLKSAEEMAELFFWARPALENTVRIAERCNVEIPFGRAILPSFPLPPGYTSERYLRELCEQGAKERYGGNVPAEVRERLEYELQTIERMGFCDYFLIVWDFVRFAHSKGIATGPGRGSAAGSLVAYLLNITSIDPIRHNLLFERFLNPERISMPDIDIDFDYERRDEVIRYVMEKYGHNHVAQIITFGTMAARAAVRDVGRVLKLPYNLVDKVAKCIPGAPNMTLEKAIQESPELREMIEDDERVAQLVEIARSIEGLPRHASTHAAGVVISREPLTDYVPLQQGHESHAQTQYPMEALEELGLLKMDFLGLRNLTIIQRTLREVERLTGERINLEKLPEDDRKTFALLSRGETTGIFQLESAGMRNVLRELQPNRFEDVVAVLALYRPGPMENIPVYIKAKHGEIPVEYPHPSLEPILRDTYGVIIYQEQIMQIAASMAGYTLGEADILRRGVGKKKKEILDAERERFVAGAKAKGIDMGTAEEVYDLIVRFANYGFNRSHSVAYAVIAYQMAYLKANYPVAFMAALLASQSGSQTKVAEYVEECRKMGIRVLPPDVNKSNDDFSVEEEGIRFGLTVIKNVGTQAVRSILEEREEKGAFKDLFDFVRRVDTRVVNRRVIESLIQAGAMDSLPGHRAQKLFLLDEALEKAQGGKKGSDRNQLELFEDDEAFRMAPLEYPEVEPFSPKEILAMEREMVGLYLSGHPLDEYRALFDHPKMTPVAKLPELPENTLVRIAGMVREIRPVTTRKGEAMAFILLEDRVLPVEVVFFPRLYSAWRLLLKEGFLLVVEGRLHFQEEEPKVVAERAWKLEEIYGKLAGEGRMAEKEKEGGSPPAKESANRFPVKDAEGGMSPVKNAGGGMPPMEDGGGRLPEKGGERGNGKGGLKRSRRVYIKVSKAHLVTRKVQKLQDLLLRHPGEVPVFLHYADQNVTKQLSPKYNVSPTLDFVREVGRLLGPNSIVVKED